MTLERESVLTLSVHLVLQAHPDTMKLTKVEELLELQVSSITVCVNEQHTCICHNNQRFLSTTIYAVYILLLFLLLSLAVSSFIISLSW